MEITRDAATGFVTLVDDAGAAHVLRDFADIGGGTFPIYRYPGHADHPDPGHVTYTPDGSSVLRHDPDRLYGRDGTVKGAELVGVVTIE